MKNLLLIILYSLIIKSSLLCFPVSTLLSDSLNTINNFQKNPIIKKAELDFLDYRNSTNFFTYLPFGFLRDLGSLGQPSEVLIYGMGYNQISFLNDNININNRLFNSFDANLFQSESIDSLEIKSLPRGFLYNNQNNPVTINFFSKELTTTKPYTRIRYYQAPNEEGMIDGIFSSAFGKKFNVYSEITNQSIDPFYRNTDYSLWMAKIKTQYKFFENFIITTNYSFTKSKVQLFGGVNTDSILNTYPLEQFENVLYDNILAPVRFYNRYQKNTIHNFNIVLKNIYKNISNDFTAYYQSNLNEFRQNDTTNNNIQSNAEKIIHDNKYETFGLKLYEGLSYSTIKLNFISEFENTKFYTPLVDKKSLNTFSSAVIISLLFPQKIGVLSTYGKYLIHNKKPYIGFGSDLLINISKKFKVYSGIASFQKPPNVFELQSIQNLETNKQNNKVIHVKSSYSNSLFKIELSYFYSALINKPLSAIIQSEPLLYDNAYYFKTKNIYLQGMNLLLNFHLGKVMFYSNTNYYFSKEGRKVLGLPEFTFFNGIYYIDSLFNSNLHLKAGLNLYGLGSRNSIFYDFEKNISSTYKWIIAPYIKSIPFMPSDIYPSEIQVDFFTAGQIKKRAIIYFVIENILDRKYFVVPYYPKQGRSLRLGIAWEFYD